MGGIEPCHEHHCKKLVLENGLRMAKYPSPCYGEQCHRGDGLSGLVRHTRTMPFTSSRSLQLDDSIDCRTLYLIYTCIFLSLFCLCLRHDLNFRRTSRVTSGPLFHHVSCLFDIDFMAANKGDPDPVVTEVFIYLYLACRHMAGWGEAMFTWKDAGKGFFNVF